MLFSENINLFNQRSRA